MTNQEFSDTFDVLLNSYAEKMAEGEQGARIDVVLDEYEKSVYLTEAQDDLVIGLYTGRNNFGTSFEETEEMRRYLSKLVKDDVLYEETNSSGKPIGVSNSHFFTLKDDVWFITYERVDLNEERCGETGSLEVIPVTQDEYHKIKRNPFRGANNRRALRLDLADGLIEVVCKFPVKDYYLRYLRRPNPIILTDIGNNGDDALEIHSKSTETPCELHEALHQRILNNAVAMAYQSRARSQQSK